MKPGELPVLEKNVLCIEKRKILAVILNLND